MKNVKNLRIEYMQAVLNYIKKNTILMKLMKTIKTKFKKILNVQNLKKVKK